MASSTASFRVSQVVFHWDNDTLEKYKSLKMENESMRRWGLIGQRIYDAKEYFRRKKSYQSSEMWDRYVVPERQSPESLEHWVNVSDGIEMYYDNALHNYKTGLYKEYTKNRKNILIHHGTLTCWTDVPLSSSGSSTETLSDSTDEAGNLEDIEPTSGLDDTLLLGRQPMEIDVVPDIDDGSNEENNT